MIRYFHLVAALIAILAAPALADTYHTPLDPSQPGGIVGKVDPAAGLQTVIAVDSTEIKAYQAKTDPTGRFELSGLPPGEYDLLIKTVGHVYEGITLEGDADTPQLAGADLKKILEEIKPLFFASEDYFDIKKIVRCTGTAERARMFVAQTRTRPTLTPAGDALNANVRRFDFVDLVKTHKAWQIVTSRHLLRQEVPYSSADNKLEFRYSPKLGGILVGQNVKDLGTLTLTSLPAGTVGKYVGAELGWK